MSESFLKSTQVSLCQSLLATHTKEVCCTMNWFWGSSVTLQLTSQHICLAGARVGCESLRWNLESRICREGYRKSMGVSHRPRAFQLGSGNPGHLTASLLPFSTSRGTWTAAGRLSNPLPPWHSDLQEDIPFIYAHFIIPLCLWINLFNPALRGAFLSPS